LSRHNFFLKPNEQSHKITDIRDISVVNYSKVYYETLGAQPRNIAIK